MTRWQREEFDWANWVDFSDVMEAAFKGHLDHVKAFLRKEISEVEYFALNMSQDPLAYWKRRVNKPPTASAIDAGTTLLMSAAHGGQRDVVEWLLSLGADPSLQDKDWNTAADMAREYAKNEVLAKLLDSACVPSPRIRRSAPPTSLLPSPHRDST
jgi:hypothetical protein